MTHRIPRAVAAMLEAMDGLAYVASPDGVLLALSRTAWDAFAVACEAPGATADRVLGRSLFDQIASEPVREAYRRIHSALLTGAGGHVAFEYRCDAPDFRRTMRMSVSRLALAQGGALILYQSQVLSAVSRPWMSLFEPGRILEAVKAEAGLPIVRLCGFCQRVHTAQGWVEPEVYYRQGGAADVRTSHGVCEACNERVETLPLAA